MNAFSEIPETEPRNLTAGNLWTWKRTDLPDDYDPSLYDLSYVARLEGDPQHKVITATASGGDFLISEVSTATAWTKGRWQWVAFITRKSDQARAKVGEGYFVVAPDPIKAEADPRSHAQITLDKIEAVIEGRAGKDVSSYSINGRSLSKYTVDELMQFRRTYRKQVIAEKNLARRKKGLSTTNVRVTSFRNG